MQAKENTLSITAAIFIAAELILELFVQFTSGAVNTAVSYAAVLLALAFVILRYTGGALSPFLLLGMAATAAAESVPAEPLPAASKRCIRNARSV